MTRIMKLGKFDSHSKTSKFGNGLVRIDRKKSNKNQNGIQKLIKKKIALETSKTPFNELN